MLIATVARISGVPWALVTVAIAGGAIAPLATAQVPITSGRVVYENASIFVANPDPNNPQPSDVFRGQQPTFIQIRTPQGDIPANAIFRGLDDPRLSTAPGQEPGFRDRGFQNGTLTFRGFTNSGEPALFSNILTRVEFDVVDGRYLGPAEPATRFALPTPTMVMLDGRVETAGGITTVDQSFETTLTQYQPGDRTTSQPQDQQAANGDRILATDYRYISDGLAFPVDFAGQLTGGQINIPNPPGLNGMGTDGPNALETLETFDLPVLSVPVFNQPTLPNLADLLVVSDLNPLLFSFPSLPSNVLFNLFDPFSILSDTFLSSQPADISLISSKGMSSKGSSKNLQKRSQSFESFTFTMKPGPQPVGMASRVFPGLSGQRQRTSLFTAIRGLPKGMGAVDRFTVTVEGIVLGEFTADQTVDFRDFRAQLGDRLLQGQGVRTFVISGIEPGVDVTNPHAFPVRLAFSTPTASFDMQATALP